jgi:hypothetical protein
MKTAGSGSDPDQDPLVRGMDPQIRIRIHDKISWIGNTASNKKKCAFNNKQRRAAVSHLIERLGELVAQSADRRLMLGRNQIQLFIPHLQGLHLSLIAQAVVLDDLELFAVVLFVRGEFRRLALRLEQLFAHASQIGVQHRAVFALLLLVLGKFALHFLQLFFQFLDAWKKSMAVTK